MALLRRRTRYLKETSDRSGFDNFNSRGKKMWESIKQNGSRIAPSEFDVPPPSNKPLGGADVSGQPRTGSDTTDIPSISQQTVLYVSAAGGISINDEPWIMVAGSASAINITANPQVSTGRAQQIIAIQCVGSAVTLEHGSGLSLTASQLFRMESGSIINLIYSATDNLWHELSRTINGGI